MTHVANQKLGSKAVWCSTNENAGFLPLGVREPITVGKERSRDGRMAAKRAKNTHNIIKIKIMVTEKQYKHYTYTLELLGGAVVFAAMCGVP